MNDSNKEKRVIGYEMVLNRRYGRAGEMAMAGAGDGMERDWAVSYHPDRHRPATCAGEAHYA